MDERRIIAIGDVRWPSKRVKPQANLGDSFIFRCKIINWLFTLGFPVQTNTDGSFLVVFEVVYVVRWYKYK